MKKITIFLAALLLVFAAGCREDASLDGLESQTKEEGTSAGENAESIAVKEALTYESALEYNCIQLRSHVRGPYRLSGFCARG